MSTGLFADAALLSAAAYIEGPFGNPLNADDFPYVERQFFGDPDAGVVIKDGDAPGVNTVTLRIGHNVPEWAPAAAVSALDEARTTAHNGYVYEAQGAGTTGGSEPAWPTTIGGTVNDNGITWECVRRTTEPESLKMATTEGGLAAATPGADIDFGVTSVAGGAVNALDVWIEVDNVAALVNVAELYISADHLVNEAA